MSETMLDAALAYAAMGWRVFPLKSRSKEPATPHGFKDATCDESTIREWWGRGPNRNIGIATGDGLCVIDVDDKPNAAVQGSDSLRDWEIEHGELADTCRAITGSGGTHILYDVGDARVPCSASAELSIDIRCDGGYIVAPPSIHPNGREYVWEVDPADVPPARAGRIEQSCIEWVHARRNGGDGAARNTDIPESPIVEGEGRNNFLYEQGCSVRAKGADDAVAPAGAPARRGARHVLGGLRHGHRQGQARAHGRQRAVPAVFARLLPRRARGRTQARRVREQMRAPTSGVKRKSGQGHGKGRENALDAI